MAAGDEEDFARAHRAIDAGDAAGLVALLDARPGLTGARGGPHRNDLLGMATAVGDLDMVRALLERGADPAAANVHGWTALHQAAYMGRLDLAGVLVAAGAPTGAEARGEGGTPLAVALFWGHRIPVETAQAWGLAPGNLRIAAGLGLLAMIDRLADPVGALSPQAGAGRGFHRPHFGFPEWVASDDPQEILDEALSWAARADRADAVAMMVARGARPDADVYRGTPLGWAAARGRMAALDRLLELGADPDGPTTFGGPEHGEDARPLHLAAEGGHAQAAEALLAAGADPSARDGRHDATPADWADRAGHDALAARLRAA